MEMDVRRLHLHLPAGWLLGQADNNVNHQNDTVSHSQSCYHFVLHIALGTGYPAAYQIATKSWKLLWPGVSFGMGTTRSVDDVTRNS